MYLFSKFVAENYTFMSKQEVIICRNFEKTDEKELTIRPISVIIYERC